MVVRDPVGVAEVSEILGWDKRRVSLYARTVKSFPKPKARLASGPLWEQKQIEDYKASKSPGA